MSLRVRTQTCTLHSTVQLKVGPALLLVDRRRHVLLFSEWFREMEVVVNEKVKKDIMMYLCFGRHYSFVLCRYDGVAAGELEYRMTMMGPAAAAGLLSACYAAK